MAKGERDRGDSTGRGDHGKLNTRQGATGATGRTSAQTQAHQETHQETRQRHGGAGRTTAHPGAGHAHDADAAAGIVPGYLGPSAPHIGAPSWKRRLYIDRPSDLRAVAADLEQAHVLAIDAEFAQVRVRQPDEPAHRLALLQLASDNDHRASYVIDALRLADLTPLEAALESPTVLKLFHGIGADARVLATRGLVARNILDLEAVSRSIFGQRESGLQAMMQRAAGLRLDKSLQRADWSRRPLTPAMVAYAARDAEMTLVLYGWLAANYGWAVALHETPADEPPPPVAPWILPYLEGARPRPAAIAVAEAGLAHNVTRLRADLRDALTAVRHPNQRARVMRLITDLEQAALAADVRPYLAAPASEERAGAARGLGRLHDKAGIPEIRPLLDDPVQDVRQAAHLAIENLSGTHVARPPRPRTEGPVRWTSSAGEAEQPEEGGWRAALRANFGIAPDGTGSDSGGGDANTDWNKDGE